MPVKPRLAATLVLVRDRAPGAGAVEVLLVERPRKAAFAAGAFVFPGGAVEEADASPLAAETADLTPEQAHALMDDAPSAAWALAHYVAAIRETFEETLLLLARPANGAAGPAALREPAALAEAREAIVAERQDFLAWIAGRGLRLDAEALVYFAHWITPESQPIRYDTRFFLAVAPPGPPVAVERRELAGHRWSTPQEALELADRGEIYLMMPTRRTLEELAPHDSVEAALRAVGGRKVPRILPKVIRHADGGRTVLYPDDPRYDKV